MLFVGDVGTSNSYCKFVRVVSPSNPEFIVLFYLILFITLKKGDSRIVLKVERKNVEDVFGRNVLLRGHLEEFLLTTTVFKK
jgi:hypothetical protein